MYQHKSINQFLIASFTIIAISVLTFAATWNAGFDWFGSITASAQSAKDDAAPPPSNDTFAGAVTLTLNQSVVGNFGTGVDSAVNDYQLAAPGVPTCFTGVEQIITTAPGRDLVYTFTASAAGPYSFRVQNTGTTGTNLAIYLVDGTPTGTTPISIPCQASGAPPPVALAAANRNTTTAGGTEEIYNFTMTAGQQLFLVVDEVTLGTTATSFIVEVYPTNLETEPNNTFATAQALSCGIEGAMTGGVQDFDYFSIGTPADGSRLFAIVDGSAGGSTDYDIRVNNATSTFQYSDGHNDVEMGTLAPNIAGLPLASVDGPYAIQVDWFSTTTLAHEPYRLFSVIQPPSASATAESEPNDTLATADSAVNNYFSGSFATVADVDVYATGAQAGDVLFVSLDNDPDRNGFNPNGNFELLDGSGNVIFSIADGSVTTTSPFTPVATQTSTTPISPGDAVVYRVPTTGIYVVRVTTTSFNATGPNNYLLSISRNCATGGGGTVLPGPGTVQFSSATYETLEAQTATITVTRTGGTTGTVTVNFATSNGTATGGAVCGPGIDYQARIGTLTFLEGEFVQTFIVRTCPDAIFEGGETVILTLSGATGGATIGTPNPATLTILDACAAVVSETEPNDTPATANVLTGSRIAGAIPVSGDLDYYRIDGVPAGSLLFTFTDTGDGPTNGTGGTTTRDSLLDVFAADGITLIENDDDDGTGNGGDGTIESGNASAIGGRVLTAGGTYYIRVAAFSTGVISRYNMYWRITAPTGTAEVEPNDTTATATALALDTLATGSVVGPGDTTDYFSVPLTANNVAELYLDGDPERNGLGNNHQLALFAPDGTTLLLNADSGFTNTAEGFNFLVPTTGTYFVRVLTTGTLAGGTYQLTVSQSASCNLAPPTAANASLGGRITTASGRGISNAIVSLQGTSSAERKAVRTSTFGNYRFDDLAAGQTYIVTVRARGYTFAEPSRVITLLDNVGDFDFVAQPEE